MNSDRKIIHRGEGAYNLIHQAGLINWHQWEYETIEKAKSENKLLFIHVGYIACGLCVDMTAFSFEQNSAVAHFINSNYIPVLIDSDEYPYLAQYYSHIVRNESQSSSWPIICFALYDGTPIFATTDLTPDHIKEVSGKIHDHFILDPLNLLGIAKDLSQHLSLENIPIKDDHYSFSEKDIHVIVEPWKRKFDKVNGGTLYPPKYPLTSGKEFLLEYISYYNDEEVLVHLKLTLNKMARGGIYDHVNGGFFHYAEDVAWLNPSFEKQIVDIATLVNLYAKAQQYMPSSLYGKVIEESLQFCMRHMLAIEGGFHTSTIADPMRREHIFYTWTAEEFKQLLKQDAELAISYYGVRNGERNVLHIDKAKQEISHKFGLTEDKLNGKLEEIRYKLIQAFNSRVLVAPDDKVITSVNAIVASAFISGYRILGYEEYFLFANETLSYIKSQLINKDGKLGHYIREGKVEGCDGFLDDYAFTIDAFINMYFIDGDEHWLFDAKQLVDYVIANFYEPKLKLFLYCERVSKYAKMQTISVVDGVLPSANSVILHCLAILSIFFEEKEYVKIVEHAMYSIKDQLPGAGPYCANWVRLLLYMVKPHHLVVVVGTEAEKIATKYFARYYTNAHLAFIKNDSKIPLFKNITLNPDATEVYSYVRGVFEKKSTDVSSIDQLLRIS